MQLKIANYITAPDAGGKFVVLVLRDDPENGILLFSDFTKDFQHADIVRRWKRSLGDAADSADRYRAAGGGWWRVEADTLVLYGQSAAYGRFDPAWVRGRLEPGAVMTESRIDVL